MITFDGSSIVGDVDATDPAAVADFIKFAVHMLSALTKAVEILSVSSFAAYGAARGFGHLEVIAQLIETQAEHGTEEQRRLLGLIARLLPEGLQKNGGAVEGIPVGIPKDGSNIIPFPLNRIRKD